MEPVGFSTRRSCTSRGVIITRYAIMALLPMNWRKPEIISLTLGGVSGFSTISCSKVRSDSCVHSHVSVKALIWAGDSSPDLSLNSTLYEALELKGGSR